jgi:ornithine cyclodeaminase
MPRIAVLTESEIRSLVGFGRAELDAIEAVYPQISGGSVSMPPIQRIDVPEHNGEIDIKSAYLPDALGIAVKVSTGFFDNPALGLPSLGGLMLVFESTTGLPAAALFDNGNLTNLRTALAGAVAAKHLARADATTVGVIGAGVQARLQVEALGLVRPIERVLVWARRSEAADGAARDLHERLGVVAVSVGSPAEAATTGGILVTTTPATEPFIDRSCLRPGLHVTAIGADAEHKRELAADALAAADLFVCDARAQSERLGELRAARADGIEVDPVELGEVIAGTVPGRTADDAITICDLTGTGAQDTAIASLVIERARAQGVGTVVET